MLLFEEQQLANGLTLCLYDCSKKLAADRWLVKMRGEVKFPIPAATDAGDNQDSPELAAQVRAQLGDSVSFIVDRERNFIDADEKETMMTEMVDQMKENMLQYLNDPAFPQKLYARRYDEERQRCLLQQQQPQSPVDDDDEPADFSACFRD